jgi:hypothetical protein
VRIADDLNALRQDSVQRFDGTLISLTLVAFK